MAKVFRVFEGVEILDERAAAYYRVISVNDGGHYWCEVFDYYGNSEGFRYLTKQEARDLTGADRLIDEL